MEFIMIKNPPIEPRKEDCCNSGCNPCIFEVYEKQLLLYKKYQDGDKVPEIISPNAISQLHYSTFILLDKVELCESHKVLTFKLKSSDNNLQVTWKPGDHFLVKYTDGDFSCTRAYTPLKQKYNKNFGFSVILKRYNNGVVSNYLWNLKPGQESIWRGPYGAYEIQPNKYNRITMIAQGTGIAPFKSIIDTILENEDDMTKLILLYCCRNVNSILFRSELYSMSSYWNFTYSVFLSEYKQNAVYKYQEPIVNIKLSVDNLLQHGPFNEKDQFLICGSTQFMKYFESWLEIQDLKNILTF